MLEFFEGKSAPPYYDRNRSVRETKSGKMYYTTVGDPG